MREIFTIYNHHEVLLPNKKNFLTSITLKHEAVARRVAGILGVEVCDISRLRTDRTGSDRNYVVPVNALSQDEAERYGVRDADSVLGGIVFHPMQAEKGALHPPVSPDADVPPWYSRSFANRVVEAGTVFPGFVAFTEDDAQNALTILKGDGFSVRFKRLPESESRGQFPVQTPDQLQKVIHEDLATFLECGAVLEAGVQDPTEINLAFVRMDGVNYSWIGMPKHETGFQTDLTVVRGDFGVLADHLSDPNELVALRQAQTVFDTYRSFGAEIGRGVLDVLQGYVTDDTFASGVVDPSLRVGGSTPAELRAIEELRKSPDITKVVTRVVNDYTHSHRYDSDGYEVFAQDHSRDIYVKLVNAT
jgi:hypothetical protein